MLKKSRDDSRSCDSDRMSFNSPKSDANSSVHSSFSLTIVLLSFGRSRISL